MVYKLPADSLLRKSQIALLLHAQLDAETPVGVRTNDALQPLPIPKELNIKLKNSQE